MAMKPTGATRRLKPVAYVEIGFRGYLLDADKALQLMKVLGEAVSCEESYEGRRHVYYVAGNPPDLQMKMVNPDDVRRRTESELLAIESNRG
ncbi:hypothetical protein ABEG10_14005 [Burkholderia cenocepacia]|uniref:hypothetical protein n=1 Tax=Burkholderia cenocepacia TaxID=95486 RepID=UPI0020A14FD4|nr:hypothetical protein [Burkholderia cenocepacia]MCO8326831.1 hypothetical protein [Burkholderia cenocepacia]MCO8333894.1 hypothetical protein [Burkholderia cenocepacia]MCO8341267.1 hypothetical protein [Burkholderia cenocepacia]MCO8348687.1 hypothetical protein [Burkholderia cenocepacia]MCO8361879.1 hypothetical protein [Burkholderia cenocepacia]